MFSQIYPATSMKFTDVKIRSGSLFFIFHKLCPNYICPSLHVAFSKKKKFVKWSSESCECISSCYILQWPSISSEAGDGVIKLPSGQFLLAAAPATHWWWSNTSKSENKFLDILFSRKIFQMASWSRICGWHNKCGTVGQKN